MGFKKQMGVLQAVRENKRVSEKETPFKESSGYRMKDSDKKAVQAFLDKESFEGKNLVSDGKVLLSSGMGGFKEGNPLAEWKDGKVSVSSDSFGNISQTWVNYVRRQVPKKILLESGNGLFYSESGAQPELQIGGKYTVFEISSMAMAFSRKIIIRDEVKGRYTYSQERKRKQYYLNLGKDTMIFEGWEQPFKLDSDMSPSGGSIMRGNAALNFIGDPDEIRQWIEEKQLNPNFDRTRVLAYPSPDAEDGQAVQVFRDEYRGGHAVIDRINSWKESTEPGEKLIRTTYEIITPESAEEGDFEETGWEDEEGESMEPETDDPEETAVYNAIEWLRDKGPLEPSSWPFSPGSWYTAYGEQDFSDGSYTNYSYHLVGFTPEEEQQIYEGLKAKKMVESVVHSQDLKKIKVVNDRGIPFNVVINPDTDNIDWGPLVQFYDATYENSERFHKGLGQFVSSYYLHTLMYGLRGERNPDTPSGIDLHGGFPDWEVSAENMREVMEFAIEQAVEMDLLPRMDFDPLEESVQRKPVKESDNRFDWTKRIIEEPKRLFGAVSLFGIENAGGGPIDVNGSDVTVAVMHDASGYTPAACAMFEQGSGSFGADQDSLLQGASEMLSEKLWERLSQEDIAELAKDASDNDMDMTEYFEDGWDGFYVNIPPAVFKQAVEEGISESEREKFSELEDLFEEE